MLKDKKIQKVLEWLPREEVTKWPVNLRRYHLCRSELYEKDGALMKTEKLVLPGKLRQQALRLAHVGHPGMSTVKNLLRQGVWWPVMNKDIEDYVRSCAECQLVT